MPCELHIILNMTSFPLQITVAMESFYQKKFQVTLEGVIAYVSQSLNVHGPGNFNYNQESSRREIGSEERLSNYLETQYVTIEEKRCIAVKKSLEDRYPTIQVHEQQHPVQMSKEFLLYKYRIF